MTDEFDTRIMLPDGRRLTLRERGAPDGLPVLHLPGAPAGSRLDVEHWHPRAEARGLRMLGVDRPGIGASDRHPGGTMRSFTEDIAAALDSLGLERVAVTAVSGGGPFGVALAGALPTRIVHLTLVAPAWFRDHASTKGMPGFNRFLWWCSRHARPVLRFIINSLMRRALLDPERSIAGGFPPVDQRAFAEHPHIEQSIKRGFQESIREGVDGVVEDTCLITAPQPFTPEEVRVPVSLWHGDADHNVPIAVSRRLAARFSNCEPHFLPGEGHVSILVNHMEAMLDELRARLDAASA